MLLDQVHQPLHGLLFGDVELHRGLADVKIDFVRRPTDVAEVRVSHFTGTVHDAAHDSDAHAFEVARGFTDLLRGLLEIEERAPTAWAGDIVRLEDAHACGLQDVVADPQALSHGLRQCRPPEIRRRFLRAS